MIANENRLYKWKTINNRNVSSKNQIVKPKTPISAKVNNRFDRLTVREDCNVDTSTNKDVTPRRTILNTKLNSRHNLRNPSNTIYQNRRPQVAIIENYINS